MARRKLLRRRQQALTRATAVLGRVPVTLHVLSSRSSRPPASLLKTLALISCVCCDDAVAFGRCRARGEFPMPIVYIHGVATRMTASSYSAHWQSLQRFLRRYVAPVLTPTPDRIAILDAYWGDLGVKFAWSGASRPMSPLLGMGAGAAPTPLEQAAALASVPSALRNLP